MLSIHFEIFFNFNAAINYKINKVNGVRTMRKKVSVDSVWSVMN